jgi:hypothetical protein
MIAVTTEIKSRCFKEYEKHRLYNTLRKPFGDKKDEIKDTFKNWLDENVLGKVLDQDLMELGRKPYCTRSTNRFLITPSEFGLPDDYIGIPNLSKLKVSLKFEFQSTSYKYAVPGNTYNVDITSAIIKKCGPEIIEQVKYFLYEIAKAEYDFDFYGVGTFVKPEYYGYSSYGLFRDLRTWGNLYSKSPEMFEQLYKMSEGKVFEEDEEKTKKVLTQILEDVLN